MRSHPSMVSIASLCACAILLAACMPSDNPPKPPTATAKADAYDMRGVVERLGTQAAPRRLMIRTEAIPDMESMTMPFVINDGVSLAGLAVGDKVSFRYEIDRNSGIEHVAKLEKLPPDTVLKIPMAASTSTLPASQTMKDMPGM